MLSVRRGMWGADEMGSGVFGPGEAMAVSLALLSWHGVGYFLSMGNRNWKLPPNFAKKTIFLHLVTCFLCGMYYIITSKLSRGPNEYTRRNVAMNDVLQQISNIGIIPVIAIEDAEQAVPLARALVAGWSACRRGDLPHRCR